MQRFILIIFCFYAGLNSLLAQAQSEPIILKRSDLRGSEKGVVHSVVQLNGRTWTVQSLRGGSAVAGRKTTEATVLSTGNQILPLTENEQVIGPIGTGLLTLYGKNEKRVVRLNQVGKGRQVNRTLSLPDTDLAVESISGNTDFFYITDAFEGAGSEVVVYDKALRQAKVFRPFGGAYRTVKMVAAGDQLIAVCEAGHEAHPITLLYFDAKTLAETGQLEIPLPFSYNPTVTVLGTDLYIQTVAYQNGQSLFKPFLISANRQIMAYPTGLLLNDVVRLPSSKEGVGLLVGFSQTKVIAIQPANGSPVWQVDLGTQADSQSVRLLSLASVGTTVVLLSGTKQSATADLDAQLTYLTNKGALIKKEPIGRIGKGVQLFDTPNALIISSTNRTLVYEKLYK